MGHKLFFILFLLRSSFQTLLELHLFNIEKYPFAVCNDGSASGFYFKPSERNSSLWIIFQQGGGWCYDEESCTEREGDLTSSLNWKLKLDKKGFMESGEKEFSEANLVYVPYCSSDGWIGNATKNDLNFGFDFRMHGAEIVNTLLKTLIDAFDLGKYKSTEVLYAGCSAGARGVLFNTHRVYNLLNSLIPKGNLGYFGSFIDSGFWLDMVPQKEGIVSFVDQTKRFYSIAKTQGNLNPLCEFAYPDGERWRCLFAEDSLRFLEELQIPNFIYAFQYDAFQLSVNLDLEPYTLPSNAEELAYSEKFRVNLVAQAKKIEYKANTVLFLPACFMHCNTEGKTWSTILTEGESLEQAVKRWFFEMRDIEGGRRFIKEDCIGFNCGNACLFKKKKQFSSA